MSAEKQYCIPEIWGGIECTINRVNNIFNDQLEYSRHYYREGDVDAIADLNIKKIRYPILWERHQPAKDTAIDWSWIEKQLQEFRNKNIDVIAGLVHHGSGPAFTHLLDDQFPFLLADYAGKVAQKFPWVNYYTPVNEPLTTARFSGLYGAWYPHEKNDQHFIQMLLNEMKGVVLSMKAIREVNPNAQLVQTEDLGKIYSTPLLKYQSDFENERRWLTYDLLCGKVTKDHSLWDYFKWLKIPEQEFNFFQEHICVPQVFGFNHYLTSERFLDDRVHLYPSHVIGGNGRHRYADVEAARVDIDEKTGIEVLLNEAWERYKQPIAITEVHLHCHREEQLRWFKYIWTACNNLKAKGVDIRAVTAWALLGSYGWNRLLTEPGGDYEPGVFDLRNGSLRPTALAKFIKEINQPDGNLRELSSDDGWWQRSTRLIYSTTEIKTQMFCSPKHDAPILIIGKNGTLGKAFANICKQRFLNYKLLNRTECNICDISSIESAIASYQPWAIINAAGYVRVDDAEKEFDRCYQDNTLGAVNLAIITHKHGIKLITFSTDLVFDGNKRSAYLEDDATNPLNVYGRSKVKAEDAILKLNRDGLIVRTSAFFGPWDEFNFVHWVRRNLLESESITVAKDIFISPTYVPNLVNATLDLLIDDEKGIWHLTNDGEITWADFAYEIADRFDLNRHYIRAIPHAEIRFPAKRPSYSVLSSKRGIHLPSLEHALRRYSYEEIFFDSNRFNKKIA